MRPIGVFDSGVGGLTVLHELLVALPHEDFVYLGDTARFPYGRRGRSELERFSLEIADELVARKVKLLVVACNSATAAALPALQRRMMETTPRRRRPGRRQARRGAGRRGHAQRAHRGPRHTDDDRQPRLPGGDHGRRRPRRRGRRGGAGARRAHRARLPGRRAARRHGARVLHAAARGGRRHGDPGLHALSARATDPPALAGSRRDDRHLGRGPLRGRSSTRSRRATSAARARPRAEYRFLCTGDADAFRTAGSRFLQMPLGEVERVALAARVAA